MKKTVILFLTLALTAAIFTSCAATQTQPTPLSRADAVNAVFNSVGINESDALYTVVTENETAETPCYDIEFSVDGVVYRYRVDAGKGDFLKITVNDQEVRPEDLPKPERTDKTKYIGLDEAKRIAYADAGIAEGDVVAFEYKMDFALGRYLYDLEFNTATHEYEYEIDAKSGEIFKKDLDGVTVVTPPAEEEKSYIGVTAAEDAALLHAGKDRETSIFEKTKWKMKKGTAVYNVEFVSGGAEYDYTVNALTGAVISFQREGAEGEAADKYIGENAAKAAALAHAGLDKADVRFESVEADVKNGKTIYEIEFTSGAYEYEYEIDAVTGDVIKADKEKD